MKRRPAVVRFAAAALCTGLGLGLLATRSGAQAAHSGVFQSASEASVISAVYSRPGLLPFGDPAGAIGFSRTKVSILGTEGIGSYLWFGDIAAGFKEAAALQAGESFEPARQLFLSLPDYPFMAKAHTPGSDAERARSTSLTGAFEGGTGIVLDAGRATATADPDAASGASVIAGAEIVTPNEVFRNAAATLRQQLATITGRSFAAAGAGVVLSAGTGRATSISSWDGPRLSVTTVSQVSDVTAFEGLVSIAGVKAQTVVTSDGRKPSAVPSLSISGVTVGPYAATLDERGLRVVDSSLDSRQLRDANDAIAQQLGVAGVDVRAAGSSSSVRGAVEPASATAAGVSILLNIERVFGRFRNQLPTNLQTAITGDNLRIEVGYATSAGATAPDTLSAFEEDVFAPTAGDESFTPQGSLVFGEQFGAGSGSTTTRETTLGAPGTSAPTDRMRLAGSVAYMGVPGWALLLGALILLTAGAALSFLGVWQML
jgi:hypothetical protein